MNTLQMMGGLALAGAALFGADTAEAHCVSGWIHMGGYEWWGGCGGGYYASGCIYKNTWGGGCDYVCCGDECQAYDVYCFYDCDGC
jgi:hypothetical protein